MDRTNEYEEIDRLLSQFKDGKKRYNEDALFNKVIRALAYGSNPIELIDQLLTMNSELFVKYKDIIQRSGLPPVIIKYDDITN